MCVLGLKDSALKIVYAQTSQKMEKWIETLDFAFIKGMPIASIWPALIVSLIKYFTTDLGDAALELPSAMW